MDKTLAMGVKEEIDWSPVRHDCRVSVIIPAYQAADHISDALSSVFVQTFTDYEVIVVNDGSPDTDEFERVIAQFRDRICYVKQKNGGPGAARNAAIRIAVGEYVAFLDSDDSWLPGYLAEQIRLLEADPHLDLVYADAQLVGDSELSGRTFMETAPSEGPVTFESLLLYKSSIITSCTVARRQALIDAGLFDDAFIRSEDFDLWIRLAHRGGRIAYQRQVLARHRTHRASLAADRIKMIEAQVEVLSKTQRSMNLTPAEHSMIERQLSNCAAQIDLEKSKQHFVAHDYDQAVEALKRANEFYKSMKLRVVLFGLCFAPRILHSLYLIRQNAGRSPVLREHAAKK